MGRSLRSSFLRKRARRFYREQEEFIGLLRNGLSAKSALESFGRSPRWLNQRRIEDPVFAERVAILDRINRGLDIQRPGIGAFRSRPHHLAIAAWLTPRQAKKAQEDLVDLRQKEAFLAMYKSGVLRTEAAHKLGLATIEVLDAMRRDREFAREIENVQLSKLWDAEDEMYNRAKDSGVDARFLMKKLTEQIEAKAPPRKKEAAGGNGPSWA